MFELNDKYRGLFLFLATEVEGTRKKKNFLGVKTTDDLYEKVKSMYMKDGLTEELKEILINYYKNKFIESDAYRLPLPLNVYYFDFWVSADKIALVNLKKSANKVLNAQLDVNDKHDPRVFSVFENLPKLTRLKIADYYFSKRLYFHIASPIKEARCSWVMRSLKVKGYVFNHFEELY